VRSGGSLADLTPAAEALVHEPFGVQPANGLGVDLQSLGLVYERAVPVQAEGGEIG